MNTYNPQSPEKRLSMPDAVSTRLTETGMGLWLMQTATQMMLKASPNPNIARTAMDAFAAKQPPKQEPLPEASEEVLDAMAGRTILDDSQQKMADDAREFIDALTA